MFIYLVVVQLLSRVWFFATPWTAALQASLSFTNSRTLLKLLSIESVIPSNHLILCHPLLLLSSIFPSLRVFSNESALCIRWPKYWSWNNTLATWDELTHWKDPDAEKDWRWGEKGTTEDEIVGRHHRCDWHEFEQAPAVGGGQGSLVCCSPWVHKEADTTEWFNSTRTFLISY